MKPKKENPPEKIMRFFTPELYIKFNSKNEKVASRASEAWEDAIEKYQEHVKEIRLLMPSSAVKLSEMCLHDAEIDETSDRHLVLQSSSNQDHFQYIKLDIKTEILNIKADGHKKMIIYVLAGAVKKHKLRTNWPFHRGKKLWLYDEIDVLEDLNGEYSHRIMFSDGSIFEIPFFFAVVKDV